MRGKGETVEPGSQYAETARETERVADFGAGRWNAA